MMMASETATLGGGCFWCLEAAFQDVRGVTSVISGYAGGSVPNPSYRQVCAGTTGHAEVVQITFDNALIDYWTILEVFFTIHDPTTLNAQGADVGTQYRSAIYYHADAQRETAVELIAKLTQEQAFAPPIVTEVAPLPSVYPAEDYHQNYYRQNPSQGYCQAVISPKLTKLRQKHRELLVA
jgi:peptide-methionine (S)-S-oxide reductase